MKANVILADVGQNDPAGKIHLLGAGWSAIGVGPNGLTADIAVAVFLEVPWDKCNRELLVELEIVDEDEQPVTVPVQEGENQAFVIRHKIVVATTPGAPNGSPGHAALVLNLQGGLPLSPGHWYTWRVNIDDEHKPEWEARFFVRRQPTAPTLGTPGLS